ncbi:tripartite motif-containing protein 14 [Notolabrus celidotus]|uniref:tripartite motif-containing protein 14 n=1 Tax=Notolabrus celidotus TaxID=1203425 RepID=UPI00148F9E1C|nr:tripartite motif-containing protein 14 [Notolabrus celidotus]
MAEKEIIRAEIKQSAQCGLTAPSAGSHSVLQDRLSFSPLDSNDDRTVQPFPRSPKLKKKMASAGPPSQEQLGRRLEELQAERSRTEAHIQSLKKRRADLSRSTEVMKQQVRERFESMQSVLRQDEQAVLDSLELDLRQTRTRLDQVLKSWKEHQDQVSKNISGTQRALSESAQRGEEEEKGQQGGLSTKKPDASETEIRLNEERFEKLLKTLSSISKQLRAQLQRKALLIDSSTVMIDKKTCHSDITLTSNGQGMLFSGSASLAPEHPLQFDRVCCALGDSPLAAPKSYWEVDVRCSSAWAVGVAYACLERKGRDKGAKLGRNRNSWCLELHNGHLSAWHNDRHVACQGVGQTALQRVGVWVNQEKGRLVFYDADSMAVLQRFSAAVTPVFDRAHHQFTEPLYPAVRFLKPPEHQTWPNHVELCHLLNP